MKTNFISILLVIIVLLATGSYTIASQSTEYDSCALLNALKIVLKNIIDGDYIHSLELIKYLQKTKVDVDIAYLHHRTYKELYELVLSLRILYEFVVNNSINCSDHRLYNALFKAVKVSDELYQSIEQYIEKLSISCNNSGNNVTECVYELSSSVKTLKKYIYYIVHKAIDKLRQCRELQSVALYTIEKTVLGDQLLEIHVEFKKPILSYIDKARIAIWANSTYIDTIAIDREYIKMLDDKHAILLFKVPNSTIAITLCKTIGEINRSRVCVLQYFLSIAFLSRDHVVAYGGIEFKAFYFWPRIEITKIDIDNRTITVHIHNHEKESLENVSICIFNTTYCIYKRIDVGENTVYIQITNRSIIEKAPLCIKLIVPFQKQYFGIHKRYCIGITPHDTELINNLLNVSIYPKIFFYPLETPKIIICLNQSSRNSYSSIAIGIDGISMNTTLNYSQCIYRSIHMGISFLPLEFKRVTVYYGDSKYELDVVSINIVWILALMIVAILIDRYGFKLSIPMLKTISIPIITPKIVPSKQEIAFPKIPKRIEKRRDVFESLVVVLIPSRIAKLFLEITTIIRRVFGLREPKPSETLREYIARIEKSDIPLKIKNLTKTLGIEAELDLYSKRRGDEVKALKVFKELKRILGLE